MMRTAKLMRVTAALFCLSALALGSGCVKPRFWFTVSGSPLACSSLLPFPQEGTVTMDWGITQDQEHTDHSSIFAVDDPEGVLKITRGDAEVTVGTGLGEGPLSLNIEILSDPGTEVSFTVELSADYDSVGIGGKTLTTLGRKITVPVGPCTAPAPPAPAPIPPPGVPPAPPVPPSAGAIVFAGDSGGDFEIYRVGPDGSDLTQLTDDPAQDLDPAWSPDRSEIAFVSTRDGAFELFLMDADGGNQRRVPIPDDVRPDGVDDPAWSPDGSFIAFVGQLGSNHVLMIVDPHDAVPIPINIGLPAASISSPTWAPEGGAAMDGSVTGRIAYERDGDIAVIDVVTGVRDTLITGPDQEVSPAWMNAGSLIAFVRRFDVYTVDADTNDVQPLLIGAGDVVSPAWSIADTGIVIGRVVAGGITLAVSSPAGAPPTEIPGLGGYNLEPDW